MSDLATRHLFDVDFELGAVNTVGNVPTGHRVIGNLAGGRFEGERLRGSVLPSGGDWGLFQPDNTLIVDGRCCFETDERWLGVAVGGSDDVLPRMRLTAVPWAMRAAIADSALVAAGGSGADSDWVIVGSDMYAGNSGYVGIGTTTPARLLELDGNNDHDGLRVSFGDAYPGLCGEFTHTT